MDYKRIEELLERYWQCRTSLEEEKALRDFFNHEEVPAHLLKYKPMFQYQNLLSEAKLSDDFDDRLMSRINVKVVQAERVSLFVRFRPLMKAAAAVAVLLTLGTAMQRSFYNPVEKIEGDSVVMKDSDPSVALSVGVNGTIEKQLSDSVKIAQEEKEVGKQQ